jgi:CRISPR/Cas system-associated exonuclease Cas4 (RecB family)
VENEPINGRTFQQAHLTRRHVEVDLRTKRLFAIGHLHHLYFQDILKEAGVLEEAEVRCEAPEVGFAGSCDALVKHEGEYYVYEFKNCHSRKLLFKDTDKHHVLQGLTYLMLLEKKLNIKIKELRLVLISRDDMLVKETGHFLTTELAEQISNEMFFMWKALQFYEKNKVLPAELEPEAEDSWQCRYCSYIEHCPKAQEWTKAPRVRKPKEKINATKTS